MPRGLAAGPPDPGYLSGPAGVKRCHRRNPDPGYPVSNDRGGRSRPPRRALGPGSRGGPLAGKPASGHPREGEGRGEQLPSSGGRRPRRGPAGVRPGGRRPRGGGNRGPAEAVRPRAYSGIPRRSGATPGPSGACSKPSSGPAVRDGHGARTDAGRGPGLVLVPQHSMGAQLRGRAPEGESAGEALVRGLLGALVRLVPAPRRDDLRRPGRRAPEPGLRGREGQHRGDPRRDPGRPQVQRIRPSDHRVPVPRRTLDPAHHRIPGTGAVSQGSSHRLARPPTSSSPGKKPRTRTRGTASPSRRWDSTSSTRKPTRRAATS